MTILILDTSLKGPLLALGERSLGRITHTVLRAHPQEAASSLPLFVDSLLHEAKKQWSDLEGLIVGIGPGSFTGIKIGMSFALGLLKASPHLKVYGSSALACFAKVGLEADVWLLPATMTHGYFASTREFGILDLSLERLDFFPQHRPAREWDEMKLPKAIVLGEWPSLRELIKRKGIVYHQTEIEARGFEILNAMFQDFLAHDCPWDARLPDPLYLRKSAPEEKADKIAEELKKRSNA